MLRAVALLLIVAAATFALASLGASLEGHLKTSHNSARVRPNPHNFRAHPMPHNFAAPRLLT